MGLPEWLKKEGFGAKTQLMRKSDTCMSTINKAAKRVPITYEVAELISAATRGEVSIDELRFPKAPETAPAES